MKVAVAGGTGQVGRHVVEVARERGHDVVVLARSAGVDLRSGTGVADVLGGADAIVDVVGVTTTSRSKGARFFEETTRVLETAAREAGTGHRVLLSIVGIDDIDTGYYGAKLIQERAVAAGDVPWTILRATQFHEFAEQMFERGSVGPLHLAMRMRTQPVAAREVAERLLDLVEAGPAGRVADLAGPREESLVEMIRAYARLRGVRGSIPAFSLPGTWGRALRGGKALPGPDATLGRQTFGEWIDAQR